MNPTLGSLVAARPALGPVFASLGLDYCCGGHRTLAEAAQARGLDPQTLALVLGALPETPAAEAPNPAQLSTAALIDHIVAVHHSYVARELPRLGALAAKVARVHGPTHPELAEVEAVFAQLAGALADHLRQEEEVLFPVLRDPARNGATDLDLEAFFGDHEEAGALTARLRTLTAEYQVPEGACASYQELLQGLAAFEADLHQHVHLENNVLFLRTVR